MSGEPQVPERPLPDQVRQILAGNTYTPLSPEKERLAREIAADLLLRKARNRQQKRMESGKKNTGG
jgi:hypothetical protein